MEYQSIREGQPATVHISTDFVEKNGIQFSNRTNASKLLFIKKDGMVQSGFFVDHESRNVTNPSEEIKHTYAWLINGEEQPVCEKDSWSSSREEKDFNEALLSMGIDADTFVTQITA